MKILKKGGVVEKRGEEETKSMPHASVVHKRPVVLAKLSVPTHYLSLFRVPWRLDF